MAFLTMFPRGIGVHGRALAITFLLQITSSRRVGRARACPRVPRLRYPSRTRAPLSIYETDNGGAARRRHRQAGRSHRRRRSSCAGSVYSSSAAPALNPSRKSASRHVGSLNAAWIRPFVPAWNASAAVTNRTPRADRANTPEEWRRGHKAQGYAWVARVELN
jgi:hypothetical protein